MAYLGKSLTSKTVEDSGIRAQAPATFDSLVEGLDVDMNATAEASTSA